MYFFANYDVVADVGVPVPPDFEKSECFQVLVNVIFETPNLLEELVDVAGVSLIFAIFLSSLNTLISLATSVVPLFVSDAMHFIYLVSAMLIVF